MKLTIDLDTLQLIAAPTDKRQIAQIDVKRGDSVPLAVSFVRDGVAEELTSGSVITFGAKEAAKYDGSAAILCDSFTKTGSGTTAVYTGTPSLDTVALNELLLVDSDDSNDVAYVDLMGELTWTDGPCGDPVSTGTFRVRVNNDVIRDSEVAPVGVSVGPPVSVSFIDISGTLTNGTNPITPNQCQQVNIVDGKPHYNDGGIADEILWNAGDAIWAWSHQPTDTEFRWESSADVATPDLVPVGAWNAVTNPNAWKPVSPATGTPVMTLTEYAQGRVGSMRVSTGFLYVVDSIVDDLPVWKKIALSSL